MPLIPHWPLVKSGMGHRLSLFSGCASLCRHQEGPNSLSSSSCSPDTILQQAQFTKRITRHLVCPKQRPFTPSPPDPPTPGSLCGPSDTCRDAWFVPVVWQQPLLFLWGPTLAHAQAGSPSTKPSPSAGATPWSQWLAREGHVSPIWSLALECFLEALNRKSALRAGGGRTA